MYKAAVIIPIISPLNRVFQVIGISRIESLKISAAYNNLFSVCKCNNILVYFGNIFKIKQVPFMSSDKKLRIDTFKMFIENKKEFMHRVRKGGAK